MSNKKPYKNNVPAEEELAEAVEEIAEQVADIPAEATEAAAEEVAELSEAVSEAVSDGLPDEPQDEEEEEGFSTKKLFWIVAGVIVVAGIIIWMIATKPWNLLRKTYADIKIKDYGTITVELDYRHAPITTANFVELAESGFYDGLTFHRIMNGFMMQGGDPQHNGYGGSAKTIKGEFSANGVKNPNSHKRGAISMARGSNSMDSASSQFFIMQQDNNTLDGYYACFGYVTSGIEIVDKICADAKPTDNNGTIPYEEQPVIESIVIRHH